MPTNLSERGRLTGALAALTIALSTLALSVSQTSTAADISSARWAGFKVKSTGRAAGGWMGGYKLGSAKAFRLEPGKKAGQGTYSARSVQVEDLRGRAAPSATATQQAAWLLSYYGPGGSNTGQALRIQSAAVDADVYHLLVGGRWRLNGKTGKKRLRQSQHGALVRSWAKAMLRTAAAQYGPSAIALSATSGVQGAGITVTAKVTNARTHAARVGVPVVFAYPGQHSTTSRTNAGGVAKALFTAAPGTTRVTATATGLPEWRLSVRTSTNPRLSALALAGQKAAMSATTTSIGATTQTVAIANAASTINKGTRLGGSYTVTGGIGTRSVTLRAYGPAATAATSSCASRPAQTFTASTSGGTASLPAFKAPKAGYYRWQVSVGSNAGTQAASSCSAPVRVQQSSTIRQAANGATTVKAGSAFGVKVSVGPTWDFTETHTLTAAVYGPFVNKPTAASCVASRRLQGHNQVLTISHQGTYTMPKISVTSKAAGYFVFRTTNSSGDLVLGATSSCGVIVKVSR